MVGMDSVEVAGHESLWETSSAESLPPPHPLAAITRPEEDPSSDKLPSSLHGQPLSPRSVLAMKMSPEALSKSSPLDSPPTEDSSAPEASGIFVAPSSRASLQEEVDALQVKLEEEGTKRTFLEKTSSQVEAALKESAVEILLKDGQLPALEEEVRWLASEVAALKLHLELMRERRQKLHQTQVEAHSMAMKGSARLQMQDLQRECERVQLRSAIEKQWNGRMEFYLTSGGSGNKLARASSLNSESTTPRPFRSRINTLSSVDIDFLDKDDYTALRSPSGSSFSQTSELSDYLSNDPPTPVSSSEGYDAARGASGVPKSGPPDRKIEGAGRITEAILGSEASGGPRPGPSYGASRPLDPKTNSGDRDEGLRPEGRDGKWHPMSGDPRAEISPSLIADPRRAGGKDPSRRSALAAPLRENPSQKEDTLGPLRDKSALEDKSVPPKLDTEGKAGGFAIGGTFLFQKKGRAWRRSRSVDMTNDLDLALMEARRQKRLGVLSPIGLEEEPWTPGSRGASGLEERGKGPSGYESKEEVREGGEAEDCELTEGGKRRSEGGGSAEEVGAAEGDSVPQNGRTSSLAVGREDPSSSDPAMGVGKKKLRGGGEGAEAEDVFFTRSNTDVSLVWGRESLGGPGEGRERARLVSKMKGGLVGEKLVVENRQLGMGGAPAHGTKRDDPLGWMKEEIDQWERSQKEEEEEEEKRKKTKKEKDGRGLWKRRVTGEERRKGHGRGFESGPAGLDDRRGLHGMKGSSSTDRIDKSVSSSPTSSCQSTPPFTPPIRSAVSSPSHRMGAQSPIRLPPPLQLPPDSPLSRSGSVSGLWSGLGLGSGLPGPPLSPAPLTPQSPDQACTNVLPDLSAHPTELSEEILRCIASVYIRQIHNEDALPSAFGAGSGWSSPSRNLQTMFGLRINPKPQGSSGSSSPLSDLQSPQSPKTRQSPLTPSSPRGNFFTKLVKPSTPSLLSDRRSALGKPTSLWTEPTQNSLSTTHLLKEPPLADPPLVPLSQPGHARKLSFGSRENRFSLTKYSSLPAPRKGRNRKALSMDEMMINEINRAKEKGGFSALFGIGESPFETPFESPFESPLEIDPWEGQQNGEVVKDPYQMGRVKARGANLSMWGVFEVTATPSLAASDETLLHRYRGLVQQLNAVRPERMNHRERLAFWLNLHNAVLMHAYASRGPPSSMTQWLSRMSKAVYKVGGAAISAIEIEYSLLRAATLKVEPFPVNDFRASWALVRPEPLVSFGLCHGTRSSPPLQIFTRGKVHQQLEGALRRFLPTAVGFSESAEVILPKIFHWYPRDFSRDDASLLRWVARHLPEEQATNVRECIMLSENGTTKSPIQTQPHDWRFRYLLDREIFDGHEQYGNMSGGRSI